MSGVVFQVSRESARREIGGKTIYFCCETCAKYFSEHAEQIATLRSLL